MVLHFPTQKMLKVTEQPGEDIIEVAHAVIFDGLYNVELQDLKIGT